MAAVSGRRPAGDGHGGVDARTDDGETATVGAPEDTTTIGVCRSCGRTVEVEGLTVQHWADKVALTHGYVDVSHTLDIVNTCAGCSGRG